jgi:hypothetical protein
MDKYYYIGLLVNERLLQVFADNRKAETVLVESGYDFVSAPFESIASAREELNRLILRLPIDFEAVKGLMAGGCSIYLSKSEFQIVDNELRRLRFARKGSHQKSRTKGNHMTKKINKDPKPTARTVARRQELAGAVPTEAIKPKTKRALVTNKVAL